MSVQITGQPPDVRTDLAILEQEALQAVREAGEHAERVMDALGPGRIKGKANVRRTSTGAGVTIRFTPPHIARWASEGTGEHGKRGRRIKSRRRGRPLLTPEGYRASVRGQRPQRFIQRAVAAADPGAERILEEGAIRATRRMAS